jgi:hypothetical protein
MHHHAEEATTTHRPATEAVTKIDSVASPVDSRGINLDVGVTADPVVATVITAATRVRNRVTEASFDAGVVDVRKVPDGG